MSNKSQLNQLSKKELLESLVYRQQQDSASLNRLVLSVAMAAKVSPQEMAKAMASAEDLRQYAESFNVALDAEYEKQNASKNPEIAKEAEQVEQSHDSAA